MEPVGVVIAAAIVVVTVKLYCLLYHLYDLIHTYRDKVDELSRDLRNYELEGEWNATESDEAETDHEDSDPDLQV